MKPGSSGVSSTRLLAVPVILLMVYLLTMPRGIAFEDDGGFAMAAWFAGIAHPPGYPLYALVGHLAAQFPIGEVAARLHAMSAFFGAAACLVLALVIFRLVPSALIAGFVALAFGLSQKFWSQALIAEVYTLNAFLTLGLLLCSIDIGRGNSTARTWYWLAFILGLSLSLHWPLVFLCLPAFAILLWPQRRRPAAEAARYVLLFLSGLLPYLWMVWRSHSDVLINFYGPISSLQDLYYMVSRQGYSEVDVSRTAGLADMIGYIVFLAREAVAQYTPAGFLLAAVGFAAQWKIWGRRLSSALTLLFVSHTASFALLLHFDYDEVHRAIFSVYPLIAWATAALWLALGLQVSGSWLARLFGAPARANLLAGAAGLLITACLAWINLPINDRAQFRAAEDYGRAVLGSVPENAELFVSGDIAVFVLGYLHHVNGMRPDVTLYELHGLVYSNRMFHPYRSTRKDRLLSFQRHVQAANRPVCTTEYLASTLAQIDYWLFTCLERGTPGGAYAASLTDQLLAYYASIVRQPEDPDLWARHHRAHLLKRAGRMIGSNNAFAPKANPPGEAAYISVEHGNFYSVLGYLDGFLEKPPAEPPIRFLVDLANGIERVPAGVAKKDVARFHWARGMIREFTRDVPLAIEEYEASVESWPDPGNEAIARLLKLYQQTGDEKAYERIARRFDR